jgi:uncharacterized membrane protein YgaE (UPF0421/DUF939 family)
MVIARPGTVASLQLAVRASAAAGLAMLGVAALGPESPLYAVIAAVIVTDLSPARTRALAMPRVAGTLVGAALGAALAPLLVTSVWSVALGNLAALLVAQLAGLRDATRLAGYVCAIVLLEHRMEPWDYALNRTVETLVGIAAAVVVSFVPKLLGEASRTDRPT